MADEKIVSIHGNRISNEAVVDPDIVETLEALVEHAKAGRIKGIAFAVTFADGAAQTAWNDAHESMFKMSGIIGLLDFRYKSHALSNQG